MLIAGDAVVMVLQAEAVQPPARVTVTQYVAEAEAVVAQACIVAVVEPLLHK
jgi:hypothetical protein